MRALVLTDYDLKRPQRDDFPIPPDAALARFELQEREVQTKPGHTAVRLRAAPVNALDLRVQAGLFPYSKAAPLVLGNEGAGEVIASERFAPGARVIVMGFPLGIDHDGTHQEAIVVPDEWVFPLPDAVSFEAGASLLVAYTTAQIALTYSARLNEGDYVFVTGATGTIGRAAIQLARAQGARPIAIVSNTTKVKRAEAEEPYGVVDLSQERVDKAILRLTEGEGAHIGVDPVGGEHMGRLIPALRRGGTLACVGYLAGKIAPVVIPYLVGWSRSLVGVDLFETPEPHLGRCYDDVLRLAAEGRIRPRIDSTWSLDEYEQAFRRVGSRQADGKVLFLM